MNKAAALAIVAIVIAIVAYVRDGFTAGVPIVMADGHLQRTFRGEDVALRFEVNRPGNRGFQKMFFRAGEPLTDDDIQHIKDILPRYDRVVVMTAPGTAAAHSAWIEDLLASLA